MFELLSHVECVAWLLGLSINYTRVVHAGRLPLEFALYVYNVLLELNFTYLTIVALSVKQPPKCILDVICISTYPFYWGFAPYQKSMWNKWKNHFSEMKRDIGMSLHEKEWDKKIPRPRQITPSLHFCFTIKLPIHYLQLRKWLSKM